MALSSPPALPCVPLFILASFPQECLNPRIAVIVILGNENILAQGPKEPVLSRAE